MSATDLTTASWCSVEAITHHANPTIDWPWDAPPVADWPAALEDVAAIAFPVHPDAWTTEHVGRVKGLMLTGWSDPIEIDVGCLGAHHWWPVLDGNHRLCAAILRGDTRILVQPAGDLDLANELLAPEVPW